jgi:hypothetical protein
MVTLRSAELCAGRRIIAVVGASHVYATAGPRFGLRLLDLAPLPPLPAGWAVRPLARLGATRRDGGRRRPPIHTGLSHLAPERSCAQRTTGARARRCSGWSRRPRPRPARRWRTGRPAPAGSPG